MMYSIQIVTSIKVIMKNFWPEVRKMLPKIEDNISKTEGKKVSMMIDTPVTICFIHLFFTSIPNTSTSQQVNNYQKAEMTSMLPKQQCVGNSTYLWTSLEAISTNHVQVFCIEV